MEAIECSPAEAWAPPCRVARWQDLTPSVRAAGVDDFAVRRGHAGAGTAMPWASADRIGGGIVRVPVAAVSLDLTVAGPAGVTRSSNGQGAGFDIDFASMKALCEVIERDAVACWLTTTSVFTRSDDEIDLGGVDYAWFRDLAAHCETFGIAIRAYVLPAVITMPVIAVELHDASGEAIGHPHAVGTAAHPDREAALQPALTEAIQARLTVIAGLRDDLALTTTDARPPTFGLAIALTAAAGKFRRFDDGVWAPQGSSSVVARLNDSVTLLAAAGYGQVARVVLSPAGCPVVTVKMFVPGLGELHRARRAPIASESLRPFNSAFVMPA